MTTDSNRDNPGVIMLPPILFALCFAAGLTLHWAWPLQAHLSWTLRVIVAVLTFVTAAVFGLGGERALHGAGTNVRPDRPTTAVVTSGIYRYTRNPLYLSLLCVYAGVSLIADTLWPFAMWIVLLPVLTVGVIQREERYLEAKFGQPYREYRARVRRWL